MIVYKNFFRIIKKNIGSISIYFVIFMVLTMAFSSFGSSNEVTNFEESKVRLCVIDRDNSVLSKGLMEFLDEKHNISSIEDDMEVIQEELFFRNVEYVLIISNGFEEAITAGKNVDLIQNIKVPDTYTGAFVDQQVNQYLKVLQAYLVAGSKADEAMELTKESLSNTTKVEVLNNQVLETKKPLSYFHQYLPYIFIAILINGLGPVLIAYNQKELRDRNNASAITLRSQNMQITAGCITFTMLLFALFIIVTFVQYSSDAFTIGGVLRIINSFIGILVSLGIALIVGYLAKNENVISMMSNTIGLGIAFLSGIFVPQEFLGDGVLMVARFLPTFWFVKANNLIDHYGREGIMNEIILSMAIQLVFAVTLFVIFLVVTKLKRDKLRA